MAGRRLLHIDVPTGVLAEMAAPDAVLLEMADFVEVSVTPSSPPAGFVRVYALTDHKLYRLDSTGTETLLAGGGGSAVTNARALVTPAIAISQANTLVPVKPVVAAGLTLDASRITLVADTKPALALSTLLTATPANTAVNPALSLGSVVTLSPSSVPQTPAHKLTRIQFDLTHRRGGSSQVNTGSAWTNPANVVSGTDGKNDGASATIASSVTAAIDGTLTLSYPAQASRTNLTISAVKLYFYVAQAGTVLANGGLDLSYNLGGSDTLLQTFTADQASLTTPLVYDITTAVAGSWANIAALKTKVRFHTALGVVGVTGSADAVEVEVLAAHTMIP